jgi:hypothetical protein
MIYWTDQTAYREGNIMLIQVSKPSHSFTDEFTDDHRNRSSSCFGGILRDSSRGANAVLTSESDESPKLLITSWKGLLVSISKNNESALTGIISNLSVANGCPGCTMPVSHRYTNLVRIVRDIGEEFVR